MAEVAFECVPCKCLFGEWVRDGEPMKARCPLCQREVTRFYTGEAKHTRPVYSVGDQYDYVSVVDGSHISSKRAHREHLKRHGLIEIGNEKAEMKPLEAQIPKHSIRREMRDNLERMKSDGTWREV